MISGFTLFVRWFATVLTSAGYMSHIIGVRERLSRFSGLPFILLSCGYRPHIVFKKIFHNVTNDESSYDMAIVPMLR